MVAVLACKKLRMRLSTCRLNRHQSAHCFQVVLLERDKSSSRIRRAGSWLRLPGFGNCIVSWSAMAVRDSAMLVMDSWLGTCWNCLPCWLTSCLTRVESLSWEPMLLSCLIWTTALDGLRCHICIEDIMSWSSWRAWFRPLTYSRMRFWLKIRSLDRA